MRSHEASPPRSLIMGGSSNLSMQYVFLLLIVVATTTQAKRLCYQDRRNDSHHDPRKITKTQQLRYSNKHIAENSTIFIVSANFSKAMN